MPNWTGGIITARGRELQAKVEAGETLVITKMKLGSGTPQAYEMDTLTDLKQPLMEFGISSKTVENNICEVTGVVVSSEIETPFYAREWGLFAQDPDEGEILYMYTTDPNPDFIPAKTAALQISATYALNIVVLNVDNIIVNIDPNGLVTTAILKNELKKYLPLSGGDMTGDITANNVYANNNVLVFNSVAEMKSSNKVKAGYTLRTQGFYTAGDGGGADYVIIDDIGEDEIDEASIIALQKGVYAKLLIKDFINIKWFGAYVDGEHDDSTAFNNCVEFLQRTKKEVEQIQALAVKTKVVIPHGIMKISDTIKVDINVMSLDGGGSVILAEGLEDNSYAIWVNNWTAKDGYATYTNIISQVGNFILTGTNRFDSINGLLMGSKEAQEGSAVIGYGGARVRMERIMIQNLNTGITWGSNQYLDSWHNISVNHCHIGLDNLSSPYNTGENINFHNSVFFGNDKMYNTSLTMLFNNCSFDYNTQWFNPPVLRAWLTDCHIEGWFFNGTENSKNPFVTTTGGRWCRFKMVGGDIGPVNTVHSGDVALFNVGTTAHQGVVLDNVYMDKLSSTYLINGTGVYRVNLCDYHDTNPDKVAPVCNLLGIDSFSGLTAIPKEITAGATEQISIVGDNLRVTTQSPAYGRSSIFVTVPTKDHSYIKLFLKAKLTVSSITTEKIWLSIETGYLDKDNNWIKKRGHQLNVQLDNVIANEWVTGTIGHPTNTGKEEPYVRFEITFYNMYVNATQVDVAELQVSGY